MARIYKQAEILMSLLVLGGARTIPDHGGILDRVLGEFTQHLPVPLQLTFSTTGVGFRCFELPDILLACQETGMVEWEHGDMRILKLILPTDFAAEIALTYQSINSFRETGMSLVAMLERIEAEQKASTISVSP